jgi:hypothetical protein
MTLKNFDPNAFLQDWSPDKYSPSHNGKPFKECIRDAFGIPSPDTYVYRAQGETTLSITQRAINGKRAHGLHNWYHANDAKCVGTKSFLTHTKIRMV